MSSIKQMILVAAVALGLTQGSRAANLVWTPADANWDLTTTNWVDTGSLAPVAFAQGDNVFFDDTGAAFQPAVALGANLLSPGSVLVDASSQYSFASTTGGKLTGSLSLVKRGSGTLILDADNAIAGPTSVEGGTLQIGNGSSRGTLGDAPITNNSSLVINRSGTLNVSNYMTGSGGLAVTGGTINMRGTNSMTGSLVHNAAILNFLGSFTLGSPSDITIAAAANTRFQISGGIDLPSGCPVTFTGASGGLRGALQSMDGTNSVSGSILVGSGSGGLVQLMAMNAGSEFNLYSGVADLETTTPYTGPFYLRGTSGTGKLYGSISLPSASLIKTDSGSTWTIYSGGNSASGILIAQGVLRLGADNALPHTSLILGQAASTAILDLAGFDQQVTILNDVAGVTNIIANSSTTSDSIFTISGPAGVYGGSIQDSISNGTHKVGLTLLSGAQQLTAECTYSGPTIIAGGGIVLVGSGSIPNTETIDIADGAALSASLRSDGTFSLGAAQTLKGNGTFNLSGNLGCQGTMELKVSKSGGTVSNDKVAVSGQMTYGGTLKLVLSGEALNSTDSLPIVSAGSYAVSAFAAIEPASPAPGLIWDTTTLATDGTLRIAGPVSGTAVLAPSGTDIIFSGTGGVPNGGFSVVSSTNVALPRGMWTPVQTGSFDGSGNFSVTTAIVSGEPQRFYSLRVP